MLDETNLLVDFSGDNEPDISVSSWSDAQISEIIQDSANLHPQNLGARRFFKTKTKIGSRDDVKEINSYITKFKKMNEPRPISQWYRQYTMSEKYEAYQDVQPRPNPCAGTKHHKDCGLDCKWGSSSQGVQNGPPINTEVKIGEEVSAVEFINWIKGISTQDCRPKLYDNITKSYMLFDTGAMTCCLPKEKGDVLDKSCTLRTADGNPMPTYGSKELKIRMGRKTYSIQAKVTNVKQPIIGMDLIAKYRLNFEWKGDDLYVVDSKASTKQKLKFVTIANNSLPTVKGFQTSVVTNQMLFELASIKKLSDDNKGFTASKSETQQILQSMPEKYRKLVEKYDILQPNFKVKPKHNITHRIETGSNSPAKCKVRPIPADKQAEVKALLDEMENAGVIEKVGANSNTNWSSALHVVREKGKKMRTERAKKM